MPSVPRVVAVAFAFLARFGPLERGASDVPVEKSVLFLLGAKPGPGAGQAPMSDICAVTVVCVARFCVAHF